MPVLIRSKSGNAPTVRISTVIVLMVIGITMFLSSVLRSNQDMLKENVWEASLSKEEVIRIEDVLKKFEDMAHTSTKGRNGLYVVKKNGKTHIYEILAVKGNGMLVRKSSWQIIGTPKILNKKFAYNITEIHHPGEREYAEIAVRFLLQQR